MQPTRALQGMRYRKLRLTTKDINKGFYKGTGSGSMGSHTKHGGYVIDWNKVRTYVCPPLEGFKVRFFFLFLPRQESSREGERYHMFANGYVHI